MDQPTGSDIRAWAPPQLDWTKYGFADASGSDPDPLDVRAQWAVGQLYADTGRTLASITGPEETVIAQQVLVAFAVMGAMGGSAAALRVAEAPWLKSFSAGSYSETRFSPSELAGGRGTMPYPIELWNLLWALMTPEKQDDWRLRLGMGNAPAGSFVQPDWGGGEHFGPRIWGDGIETW